MPWKTTLKNFRLRATTVTQLEQLSREREENLTQVVEAAIACLADRMWRQAAAKVRREQKGAVPVRREGET